MIRKRKTAPVGSWGGSKFNSSNSKIEPINFSGPKNPAATPANDLISVSEACDRSGEGHATIIAWCVKYKIGQHVRRGRTGDWMIDHDRLERLLAKREAAS